MTKTERGNRWDGEASKRAPWILGGTCHSFFFMDVFFQNVFFPVVSSCFLVRRRGFNRGLTGCLELELHAWLCFCPLQMLKSPWVQFPVVRDFQADRQKETKRRRCSLHPEMAVGTVATSHRTGSSGRPTGKTRGSDRPRNASQAKNRGMANAWPQKENPCCLL